jgi:pyrimidine-nucleoside phosphorylase
MRAVDVIRAKRDGGELSPDQIDRFVRAAVDGSWPDYQLASLLMAVWLRGMSPAETAHLTKAMADSGRRYDLADVPGVKVDKHSTGGVGDKTSLVLAPLAAACGVVVPMMSGRGLGHTGGTLDKLESIPGFRVHLSESEFKTALRATGVGMTGQTADVAPADKKLYALRDVTGTVESIPLITASILSKKLAEGISGLVMDVTCGQGAFMKSRADARTLADSLVRIGTANGLRVEALMTAMDAPLGRTVGNAIEVIECIETLKGHGPPDVEELSVRLAAAMVRLAKLADDETRAMAVVRAALSSGAGLDVFRKMVEQQGGDPRVVDDPSRLPLAPKTRLVPAPRSGYLTAVFAGTVGVAATVLGAGRDRAEDAVDAGVGIAIRAKPGEQIRAGEPIFEVRYRDGWKLDNALALLEQAYGVGDAPPPAAPLVLETIR